jgi:membrane protein
MQKKISKTYKKVKSQLREYFLNILDITKKPEMSILPGQLAFTILLSTVPIITFTGYLVSILNLNTNYIIDLLNNIIPGGSSYLVTSLSAFKTQISVVDVLIFIWMFYIATNGCNTVIIVSNQIYGINSSTWLKRRLKAIFMTLYIILLIVFVVLSPIFIDSLFDLFDRIIIWNGIYGLINYLRKPFMFLLIYIFLRVFYNFAPDRVRENSHLKTGALFTTIGWFIVTSIYQHSASNMATYTAFYGALANVAIIMIWLYFVSYIFVIGLILNFGEESKEKDLEKTGAIKIIKER